MGYPLGFGGLVFRDTYAPGSLVAYGVAPSDVLQEDRRAAIQAAIDLADAERARLGLDRADVHLYDGDYYVSGSVDLRQGTQLIGRGFRRTRVLASAGFVGGADTATNAVFRAQGTTSGLATTLTNSTNVGVTALTVASTAGYSPGDFALLLGPVAPGSPIVYAEIVKILSVAGLVLNLAYPTRLSYSNATATVQKITPLQKVGVYGIELDCSLGTVANGVLMRSCLDVNIEEISGVYLSRALASLDVGTDLARVFRLYGKNANNGILFIDAAHAVSAHHIDSTREAALRLHPLGIQRGLIHLRNRPVGARISDCTLQRSGVGVNIWGGYDCEFYGVQVMDMDSSGVGGAWDRMLNAAPAEATGFGGGTGINILSTTVTFTEHTYDLSFSHCKIHDCKTNAGGYWFYAADSHELVINDLSVFNYTGTSSGSYGAVALSDIFGGKLHELRVQGIARGVVTLNFGFIGGTIDWYRYDPTFSDGLLYVAMELNHTQESKMHVRRFIANNLTAGSEQRLRYGAGFVGDNGMTFQDCNWEPGWEGNAVVARNSSAVATFAIGDIVELYGDASGRLVRQATATTNQLAVVLQNGAVNTDPDTRGYMLVLPLRNMRRADTVNVTAGAVVQGDRLVWDAANPKNLKVDNAIVDEFLILARADTFRAAGGAQIAIIES